MPAPAPAAKGVRPERGATPPGSDPLPHRRSQAAAPLHKAGRAEGTRVTGAAPRPDVAPPAPDGPQTAPKPGGESRTGADAGPRIGPGAGKGPDKPERCTARGKLAPAPPRNPPQAVTPGGGHQPPPPTRPACPSPCPNILRGVAIGSPSVQEPIGNGGGTPPLATAATLRPGRHPRPNPAARPRKAPGVGVVRRHAPPVLHLVQISSGGLRGVENPPPATAATLRPGRKGPSGGLAHRRAGGSRQRSASCSSRWRATASWRSDWRASVSEDST